MKKQTDPSIKAYLVRSGLILLSLLAVCVIPFALAQRTTTKQSAVAAPLLMGSAPVSPLSGSGAPFTFDNTGSLNTARRQHTATLLPNGCTPIWLAGPNMPSPAVRSVGVYFPANGKFYAMGGRSADTAGSDFTHPFEYDPATNAWTTKAATYPDNQVNNMACGVLNFAGTDFIYCVGGSAAGQATATARMFYYDPVTDTIGTVVAPWPGAGTTVLPGGFTVFQNKLYILGGFNINVAMTNQIWEYTPTTNVWLQKAAVLPVARGYIPTSTIGTLIFTGGGSDFTGGLVVDTTDSFVYNPVGDVIGTIASIPRATGETRALTFNDGSGAKMWVMGGGRTA